MRKGMLTLLSTQEPNSLFHIPLTLWFAGVEGKGVTVHTRIPGGVRYDATAPTASQALTALGRYKPWEVVLGNLSIALAGDKRPVAGHTGMITLSGADNGPPLVILFRWKDDGTIEFNAASLNPMDPSHMTNRAIFAGRTRAEAVGKTLENTPWLYNHWGDGLEDLANILSGVYRNRDGSMPETEV